MIRYPEKSWLGDKTTDTKTEIGFIIGTSSNLKYGTIVITKEQIPKCRMVLEERNGEIAFWLSQDKF